MALLIQLLPMVAAAPPVHDWTTNPAATLPYLNGSAFPRYIQVIKRRCAAATRCRPLTAPAVHAGLRARRVHAGRRAAERAAVPAARWWRHDAHRPEQGLLLVFSHPDSSGGVHPWCGARVRRSPAERVRHRRVWAGQLPRWARHAIGVQAQPRPRQELVSALRLHPGRVAASGERAVPIAGSAGDRPRHQDALRRIHGQPAGLHRASPARQGVQDDRDAHQISGRR